jgi:hypothetical protein
MAWRLVASLGVYIEQINQLAPGRSRASDGTIGDAAHQVTMSDHNPHLVAGLGPTPVVTAADITHDPAHGCDCGTVADELRVSRDARIKYVIFSRRMFSSYASSGYPPWTWRPYGGSDPHTNHSHLSVVDDARADGTQPWLIGEETSLMAVADTITFELRPWTADTLQTVQRLEQAVSREEVRDAALRVVVDVIAAQTASPGTGGVSAESIMTQIQEALDRTTETVTGLQRQLQSSLERIAQLEAQVAAWQSTYPDPNPNDAGAVT